MFQYKSPEHKYVRVCCFGLVSLFLIIFMDHGSCSSRNVSFTIHIWRGLVVLNGGMYHAIIEIESKTYKLSRIKFWFSQDCWFSCHYVQLRGLNKNFKHKNAKTKIQRNHKHNIFLNKHHCWQNYMILSSCHLIFPISLFECKKTTNWWYILI